MTLYPRGRLFGLADVPAVGAEYRLYPPQLLYACQVVSAVCMMTSDWPSSSRTTNGMWLAPPVSSRTSLAMYTPETAVLGTAHEADTAQLPASVSPVVRSLSGAAWTWRRVADDGIVATSRAPFPW